MVEFEELNFGDKIYVVDEKNNAFTKKKIQMIDNSGNKWFRYDRDNWEYSIEEREYCGKVTFVEEGEVRFDEDRLTEYHFRHPSGQIHGETDPSWPEDFNDWFTTREEAEKYIELKKIERASE
jgi:hypothetical protein